MKSPIAAATMALTMLEPVAAAEPELRPARAGERTVNTASAEIFTGNVEVETLFAPVGLDRTSAGSVSLLSPLLDDNLSLGKSWTNRGSVQWVGLRPGSITGSG